MSRFKNNVVIRCQSMCRRDPSSFPSLLSLLLRFIFFLFFVFFFVVGHSFTSRLRCKRKKNQRTAPPPTERKRENWLVNACLARSLFFSCAFFSLTMSLFDMPVAHELCYWCSNVVIGMVEKKRNSMRVICVPRCTTIYRASDFLFL